MITCYKSINLKHFRPLLFHRRNTQLVNLFRHLERGMATKSGPKIFITRSDYPEEGIKLLKERCDVEIWSHEIEPLTRREFLKRVVGKDGIYISLSEKVDEEVIKAAGENKLKVISTMSVGVDHIDLTAAKRAGVKVGYTPDVLTEATAELTVALLLATSRRLFEANRALHNGKWKSWAPQWMCGSGLDGSTVGIFGLGRIGLSVAKKLLPFGVKRIIYTGKSKKKEGDGIGAVFTDFNTFLKESDFICVNCALTPETTKIFNGKRFSMMKPNAIFVNTSRGGVVDQDSLFEALRQKRIAGAGLDVMMPEPIPTDHPLTKLDNIVLLPHIGSATIQARQAMGILAAQNIIAVFDGKKMPAEIKA